MKMFKVTFFILIFTGLIIPQMRLNLPSDIPSDNLSLSTTHFNSLSLSGKNFESGLKLRLPEEVSLNQLQLSNDIRMMVLLHFIYGITTGDFNKNWSGLIGGYASFAYFLTPLLLLTGTVGYLNYIYAEDIPQNYEFSYSAIPILLGLRYYFTPFAAKLMFYAMLQLGLHLFSYSATFQTPFGSHTTDESESKFGIHPGLGLMLALSSVMLLDFNIQYMLIPHDPFSINSFAFLIGLAYAFSSGMSGPEY
jgi:hypothetical protein